MKQFAAAFMFLLLWISDLHAQKLMVGYSGVTAIQAPFWFIKDAGFLQAGGVGCQSHLYLFLVNYGAGDAGWRSSDLHR